MHVYKFTVCVGDADNNSLDVLRSAVVRYLLDGYGVEVVYTSDARQKHVDVAFKDDYSNVEEVQEALRDELDNLA